MNQKIKSGSNYLQRKYSNFSINEERKKFDYIKSLYNKKLCEKYKNCGYPDDKPIQPLNKKKFNFSEYPDEKPIQPKKKFTFTEYPEDKPL